MFLETLNAGGFIIYFFLFLCVRLIGKKNGWLFSGVGSQRSGRLFSEEDYWCGPEIQQ